MESFKKLSHLQTLYLIDVKISDIGLKPLQDLKDLQDLNLRGTQSTDEGLANLSKLKKLKKLVVPNTITDQGLVHLKSLASLEELSLLPNRQFDAGSSMIAAGSESTEALMMVPRVTDKGASDLIAAIPNLKITRETDLQAASRMVLAIYSKYKGDVDFDDKGDIVEISFQDPAFDNAKLALIQRLTTLRKLSLIQTSVTDGGLSHLKDMTRLEELYLMDSKITPQGIENLKKTLPRLRVRQPER
jgi:internalin A